MVIVSVLEDAGLAPPPLTETLFETLEGAVAETFTSI
jgi:hypothetical protein